MSIASNQILIDQKDWAALSQSTEIIDHFNFNQHEWQIYVVGIDFYTEFMFTANMLDIYFDNGSSKAWYYEDVFGQALIKLFNSSIPYEDIVTAFKQYVIIHDSDRRTSSLSGSSFRTANGKFDNDKFYRAIIDIEDTFIALELHLSDIDLSVIRNFTKDEFLKLLDVADRHGLARFNHRKYLKDIFDNDILSMIEYILKSENDKLRKSIGNYFSELSEDEFIDISKKIEANYTFNDDNKLRYIYNYFKLTNKTIPSDIFDTIISHTSIPEAIQQHVSNLSIDTITKYPNYVNANVMARSNMDLDTIKQLKGPTKYDISNTRFFTEEEIIAHPYFFDPAAVKEALSLYVSESTFKLLNRTWGKRQRWTSDLTDAIGIIYKISGKNRTSATLTYLKRKGNINNNTMFNIISGVSLPDLGNINILQAFIEKYK